MKALVLALLLPATALALGPFEKNHPLIEKGTAAYQAGKFEEALQAFDDAAKERPKDPKVQYNRGLALHKLERQAEARQAFAQADEYDTQHELSSKIHYNLGNVAAAEGDKPGAIKEYRTALRKDPADEPARHNLEVLLRDLPPKQNSPDGGTPDAGKSDAGTKPDAGQDGGSPDAGVDAGTPDGGKADGGEQDGGSPQDGGADGGSDGGTPQDGGQGDGGHGDAGQGDQQKQADAGQGEDGNRGDAGVDGGTEERDGGTPEEGEVSELTDGGSLSKKEAEKMLDALKHNEKNLQLWRFKKKTQRNETHGKDW